MVAGLIETEERWRLPYRDLQVAQVRVSYQLTLLLDGAAQVSFETEVLLTHGPLGAPDVTPIHLDPERQDVAPALALFSATVLSAVAFKTGALRLVFDTGTHLNAKPHPQYEAWSARGPDALLLVCQPGGSVAIWS